MDNYELVTLAIEAKNKSYSPYSEFKVGAALLTKSGKVYTGANIESAAYSPSNCAERTAFFTAVFEGEREFEAIAIAGGFSDETADYCYPCGVCRQVMMEFCDPDSFRIIAAKDKQSFKEYLLRDILPFGFGPKDLSVKQKRV